MIFSYIFIFLLCVGNCYTNDLNHTKTNAICESEKLLERFSRQNVVKQTPKVEAKKSESAQVPSKSQKPSEKKMEPRTNSL
jgi:hypothetical protein